MRRWKEKLSKIKMPHTYVILTIILLVVVALCYLSRLGSTSVSWIRSAGKLWSFPIPSTLPRGRSRGCSTSFCPSSGGMWTRQTSCS